MVSADLPTYISSVLIGEAVTGITCGSGWWDRQDACSRKVPMLVAAFVAVARTAVILFDNPNTPFGVAWRGMATVGANAEPVQRAHAIIGY
jgi:hypothetical protein